MANPDPNYTTRWQKGQSGNPGGKTSEHRKAEIKAGELAAKSQLMLVQSLHDALSQCTGDAQTLEYLTKEVNALIKNAQDRAYGAPKTSVDLSSEDGSMSPAASQDAVLDALRRKHAPDA